MASSYSRILGHLRVQDLRVQKGARTGQGDRYCAKSRDLQATKSAGRSCLQPERRSKVMPLPRLRPPEWRLERHGMAARLHLTGDWIARETGIRSAEDVCHILDDAGETTLRVDASNL